MIFGKPYDNFMESLVDLFDLVSYFHAKIEKDDLKLKLHRQTLYQIVIVRIVSVIESYLNQRFVTILNSFHYYNKAFYEKQIKISTLYKHEILGEKFITPVLGDIIANQYSFQNISDINEAYRKILNEDIFDGDSKRKMEEILMLRHRVVHKQQEMRPKISCGFDEIDRFFKTAPYLALEELITIRKFITEFVTSVEVRLRQKTFKCWLAERKIIHNTLDYEKLQKDYLKFLDNFHYDQKTKRRKAKEVKLIWDLDMKIIGKT